jgi:hypothetical protein
MGEPKYPDVTVQLSGEDGNAFFIIGRVMAALRRAKVNAVKIDDFRREAMDGDYDHVLQTCMKWVEVE